MRTCHGTKEFDCKLTSEGELRRASPFVRMEFTAPRSMVNFLHTQNFDDSSTLIEIFLKSEWLMGHMWLCDSCHVRARYDSEGQRALERSMVRPRRGFDSTQLGNCSLVLVN